MTRFIPREKMGRKARRELDRRNRAVWSVSPVTRTIGSKKRYNRKRKGTHEIEERFVSFFHARRHIVFPAPAVYNRS